MKKLLFIVLIFSFACTNSTNNKKIHQENSIFVEESDFEKIKYQDSELIKDYYCVPLETSVMFNLIGKIDKIVFHKDKIFVLDRKISKSLFIFSQKGKFIKKINNIGDGPGEFKEPQDFIINAELNQIIIYCNQIRKLLFFDLDGNYLSEISVGLNFTSIAMFNNKYYIFTHSVYNFRETYGEIPYDLIVLDKDAKIIDKQFPNDAELGKGIVVITHNSYFTKTNDSLYLSWVLNNTIYKISENNKAVPYCYFDFGKHNIPEQIKQTKKEIDIYKDVAIDGLFWAKYGPLKYANGNFLCQISAGKTNQTINNFYNIIFSDNLKSKLIFNKIEFKNDDAMFNFPLTNKDKYFVSVLYPEEILSLKKKNNDNTDIKLKGIKTKISKFDNPILMFTKFK
jgi:hypothetical protein